MNKKTFYVTTPIYYPSGNLHIGHAYTTTLAWVLKNFKTLDGFDAKFLTGADEHGQKIEEKAKENNLHPQEYVDKMSQSFVDLWKLMDIDYDYFSRTTNPIHEQSVQKQISELVEKGLIYKGKYKGFYSISDEEFLTKTQAVEKDGKFYHPTSGHELKIVEEESYFFKMSMFADWLVEYYKENPKFIIPDKIIHELVNNFLSKGLEDLSISRSTFKWGIPLLEDPKHVIYVWFDALNNYITALGYNSDDDSDFVKYWKNGTEIVHLVGKEIARFHGIYWPIILKSLDLRQPSAIISHGWLVTNEGKMSKSKGNVINPVGLIEKYGAEELKYYLASQITVGQDGVFNEEIFVNTINAELANTYGNLLSRSVAMTVQNFEGNVKHVSPTHDIDKDMYKKIESSFNEYKLLMNEYKISKAIKIAIKLAKDLNGYIDLTMPWKLKEDKARLNDVLNLLLNGIYAVTVMLSVVIKQKASVAKTYLAQEELTFDKVLEFTKFDNATVIKGEPLFARYKM